jgi:hypothetical protein
MAAAVGSLLALLAAGYGLIAAALYLFQPQLVFLPGIGRDDPTTPAQLGLRYETLSLPAGVDVSLRAWYVPAEHPRGAVLLLHGNAGSIAQRIDWLPLFRDLRLDALLLEYRGYGRSTGTPSEAGIYEDAMAGWDWLTRTRAIPASRIVVLGESLGGAPAAWLAARVQPGMLVLHSSFTSAPDLAAELYPWLPARQLTRFELDTRGNLARVAAPVLIAHSPQDEVVPYAHGKSLFAAAREPKRFVELSGGHNDGYLHRRPEWIAALAEFVDAHLPAQ